MSGGNDPLDAGGLSDLRRFLTLYAHVETPHEGRSALAARSEVRLTGGVETIFHGSASPATIDAHAQHLARDLRRIRGWWAILSSALELWAAQGRPGSGPLGRWRSLLEFVESASDALWEDVMQRRPLGEGATGSEGAPSSSSARPEGLRRALDARSAMLGRGALIERPELARAAPVGPILASPSGRPPFARRPPLRSIHHES